MILFPAIDLLGGRAVRLHKGERDSARVYDADPAARARAFAEGGARFLHVVDLDAAFGEPRQTDLIRRIVKAAAPVPVQVGGGLRTIDAAEETLEAGAARVIFGTAVAEEPDLASEAVRRFSAQRVACGIDVKDGRAATRGWTERGPATAQLATALSARGVEWLIVTAVARDGTLAGFDLHLLREVGAAAPRASMVASGGAGDLSHLRALVGLPRVCGAIAGTALYEGRFTLAQAQAALDEAEPC
jgi:phosphoribosylformimino-5-aminoimidazole carboxamide ribotide isomerase